MTLVAAYLFIIDAQPNDCDFKVLDRIPFEVRKGDVDIKSSWEESEWQFFLLEAAWLNEVRCPGGRPSVS